MSGLNTTAARPVCNVVRSLPVYTSKYKRFVAGSRTILKPIENEEQISCSAPYRLTPTGNSYVIEVDDAGMVSSGYKLLPIEIFEMISASFQIPSTQMSSYI